MLKVMWIIPGICAAWLPVFAPVALAAEPDEPAAVQLGKPGMEAEEETAKATKTSTAGEAAPTDIVPPEEYEPPPPPTAAEVESAKTPEEMIKLYQREVEHYGQNGKSFASDVRDVIRARYDDQRERIAGQYDRILAQLEEEERSRRLEAIARFEEFLKKYPDDPDFTPDAMFRLAELYFERDSNEYLARTKIYEEQLQAFDRGDLASEPTAPTPSYAATINLYKDLLGRFPAYRHADAARYLLGYSYAEQGQVEDSLAMYTELVEKHPDSKFQPEVWTRIGEIYFDRNKEDSLERAVAAYQKVLKYKDSPYYDKALYKLAWTYYRLDKFDEAVDHFVQLVDYADEQRRLTGKTGSELRTEAIQYIALSLADEKWGGLEKAKTVLGNLGKKDYVAELWKRYGEITFDQTRYPLAIEIMTIAMTNYPNAPQNPEVQSKIVMAYERMRDFDNATRAREQLVANFSDTSAWAAANASNKEALARARELTERSLYSAAIYNHQQAQAFKKAGRKADAERSYQRAAQSYEAYLKRFPESKNAYDFNFFLAECFYYSNDLERAAAQYEKVRDSNADNRHLEAAALSAVITYEKEIENEEGSGRLAKLELKTAQQRGDAPVTPRPLDPLREKLVKASDRFLTLVPKSDRAPAIGYRAAELYYKHDQFDEARKRFEQVIINHPGTEVARFSANLIIESYLAAKDYANVEKWSTRLIEIAQASKTTDPNETKAKTQFVENLQNFRVGARFKQAEQQEATGQYEAAANTYVQLVDETPNHQFADKALFNAAIDYEKVNRFDTASKVYQRIYDNYPSSELADRALFRVGVNFEKGFDFAGAIAAYTKLVERYPNSQHRADALYNVAVTLENMQQYGQSAAAFKRYAQTFPDREDAGDIFFRAATVYEKMKAWPEMVDTLDAFVKKYGTSKKQQEKVVAAYEKMGDAYRAQGNDTKAVQAYKTCISEYEKRRLGTSSPAAQNAAACTFEVAEDLFHKYDQLKIAGTGKKQVAALTEKAKLQRQVEQSYTNVFNYKRAEPTLAASYRIGHSYERFAEAMYNAEIPPEFKGNEELANEYKTQLEEKAAVLERKAEAAYRKAYEEAKRTRVSNEWTQLILEGLNKYQPKEFPVQKTGKASLQTFTITGHGLDTLDVEPRAPPKQKSADGSGQTAKTTEGAK